MDRREFDKLYDNDLDDIAMFVCQGSLDVQFSSSEDKDQVRRQSNKQRTFGAASQRINRFYFETDCTYSNLDFERRFRIPLDVFRSQNLVSQVRGPPIVWVLLCIHRYVGSLFKVVRNRH